MKKTLLTLIIIIISVLVTYYLKPEAYRVHHHANMAVYIDTQQWDFSKDIYMEEVARCNVTVGVRPEDRIHLHENLGDLIHVHMAASTWWDLYSNLLWTFGSGYLVDDYGKMYTPQDSKNIYFILNGEVVNNPWNTPVASEDKLLIWYGTGTSESVIERYYPLVSGSAKEYNNKEDPASCSANEKNEFFAPVMNIWDTIREWFPHSHDASTAHS